MLKHGAPGGLKDWVTDAMGCPMLAVFFLNEEAPW